MKDSVKSLELPQSLLISMVSAISGAVDKKSVHPGLSFAMVTVIGAEISMVALDFEVQVLVKKNLPHGQLHDRELSFCIPVKKVLDFIRALPDDEIITLKFDESDSLKVTLIARHCRLEAASYSAKEFPQFEGVQCKPSFSVQSQCLKDSLDSISFSMAQSDIRYYLNGMLWDIKEDTVVCVATDGHRLAVTSAPIYGHKKQSPPPNLLGSYILPRRTILELNKLISTLDEQIHISVGQSLIEIEAGSVTLTSKLIEGKFPNYARVLPKDKGDRLQLNKERLKSALMQVQPIISQKNRGVELRFFDDILKIYAQNSQGEEVTVDVKIDTKSKRESELSLGLNIGYVYEYLQTVKGETVDFFIKNSKAGVLLSHNEITKYLVMPLTL